MHAQNYAYQGVEALTRRWHCLDMDNMSNIREARGLSQQQLAEMIGANQATISKIESGVGNPTLSMINRIAKALRVHPSELFTLPTLEQRALTAIQSIQDEREREAAIIVLEKMAGPR